MVPNPFDFLYEVPDKLAKLLIRLRNEKERKDRDAAQYFTNLASTLDGMVQKLERREVPHDEGHEFTKLIKTFEVKTAGISQKRRSDVDVTADDLKDLAERASRMDTALFVYLPDVERERAEWLRKMKGMVGDCKGIADALKPPADQNP